MVNWSTNKEFLAQNAVGTIDFSKKHMENLKRKHNSKRQDAGNQSSVFLIQPVDIVLKMRSNLNPEMQPHIPKSTMSFEMSDLTVSFDEQVYKDAVYLNKFFQWHAESKVKTASNSYLKFRPPYNLPVKSNARAYWRFAIKATLYLLKKEHRNPGQL